MITKEMKVIEVINLGEEFEAVFERYHLDCARCSGARWETLEQAAKGHGIDPQALLQDLREAEQG